MRLGDLQLQLFDLRALEVQLGLHLGYGLLQYRVLAFELRAGVLRLLRIVRRTLCLRGSVLSGAAQRQPYFGSDSVRGAETAILRK